jgi:hypothetical protein
MEQCLNGKLKIMKESNAKIVAITNKVTKIIRRNKNENDESKKNISNWSRWYWEFLDTAFR